jgi:FKBP-type peptidyl-prolyl cis-trans isomerase FkpA
MADNHDQERESLLHQAGYGKIRSFVNPVAPAAPVSCRRSATTPRRNGMKSRRILAMAGLLALNLAIAPVTAENLAPEKPAAAGEAEITSLKIIDTKTGDGTEAEAGNTVVVHYTGWLYDPDAPSYQGRKFDSSLDRGRPFSFPLGAGRVIKGWDEGVAGMKVGGKRTLIIPADMAYGARGAGRAIPPNAALVFDVELLEVR